MAGRDRAKVGEHTRPRVWLSGVSPDKSLARKLIESTVSVRQIAPGGTPAATPGDGCAPRNEAKTRRFFNSGGVPAAEGSTEGTRSLHKACLQGRYFRRSNVF